MNEVHQKMYCLGRGGWGFASKGWGEEEPILGLAREDWHHRATNRFVWH